MGPAGNSRGAAEEIDGDRAITGARAIDHDADDRLRVERFAHFQDQVHARASMNR